MKAVLQIFKKMKNFLFESKQELGRVSWPSKQELWDSTMVVIFVSIMLAVFVGIFDRIFTTLVSLIVR
ncbi:preprotein translocase subunit SecE [candidate division WOR-3 bacterium]|nr:preprotein translocase subunit SecE [candidate division WOR-3 bacterium]